MRAAGKFGYSPPITSLSFFFITDKTFTFACCSAFSSAVLMGSLMMKQLPPICKQIRLQSWDEKNNPTVISITKLSLPGTITSQKTEKVWMSALVWKVKDIFSVAPGTEIRSPGTLVLWALKIAWKIFIAFIKWHCGLIKTDTYDISLTIDWWISEKNIRK